MLLLGGSSKRMQIQSEVAETTDFAFLSEQILKNLGSHPSQQPACICSPQAYSTPPSSSPLVKTQDNDERTSEAINKRLRDKVCSVGLRRRWGGLDSPGNGRHNLCSRCAASDKSFLSLPLFHSPSFFLLLQSASAARVVVKPPWLVVYLQSDAGDLHFLPE